MALAVASGLASPSAGAMPAYTHAKKTCTIQKAPRQLSSLSQLRSIPITGVCKAPRILVLSAVITIKHGNLKPQEFSIDEILDVEVNGSARKPKRFRKDVPIAGPAYKLLKQAARSRGTWRAYGYISIEEDALDEGCDSDDDPELALTRHSGGLCGETGTLLIDNHQIDFSYRFDN